MQNTKIASTNPDKEKVLRRYPQAVAKNETPEPFRDTWTVYVDTGVWGMGYSEAEAWRDARQRLELREGRRF